MRKVNQSRKELHESRLTDFVNHARTSEELNDLIEDENEKVSKKFKKEGKSSTEIWNYFRKKYPGYLGTANACGEPGKYKKVGTKRVTIREPWTEEVVVDEGIFEYYDAIKIE